MKLSQLHLQHLYWRTGFGASLRKIESEKNSERKIILDRIFDAAKKYKPLKINNFISYEETAAPNRNEMQQKQFLKKRSRSRKELNVTWTNEMAFSEGFLREKMALFWHGHFAATIKDPILLKDYLEVLRENALGNFGTLLHEVSKTATMLKFLSNRNNRKGAPNENFARELMELFTIGKGNYTEKDVKEAARAFTGWTYDERGRFEFREKRHDGGAKTIFGKTKNFQGDDVLDLLLEKRETALLVVRKLYAFLVNDHTIPEARLAKLAQRFFDSNYDISKLLREMLESRWFYEDENIGVLIKSPTELMAGIQKMMHLRWENERGIWRIEKALGQILLSPPNVAGWPGGRSWITANTVIARAALMPMMLRPAMLKKLDKSDKEDRPLYRALKKDGGFGLQMDTAAFKKDVAEISHQNLLYDLLDYMFQVPVNLQVTSMATSKKQNNYLLAAIEFSKMPEYQLC